MPTTSRWTVGSNDYDLVARLSTGIGCPRCGLALAPVAAGNPFSFACEARHVHQLEELLEIQGAATASALERATMAWEKRLDVLRIMASRAMRRGEALKASDIYREVNTIEGRIQVIRQGLRQARSGEKRP